MSQLAFLRPTDTAQIEVEEYENCLWFRANYDSLKKQYGKWYVAVSNRKVIDNDSSKRNLESKLRTRFSREELDTVYIGRIPDPDIEVYRRFMSFFSK